LESLRKLKALGLTEYEAKVYLQLVIKGELDAYELSKASEVPLPRVYQVLEELKKKGFVREALGRPKRFDAVPPLNAVDNLKRYVEEGLKAELNRISEVGREVQSILDPYYWSRRLRLKPEALLESLPDLLAMEEETRRLIEEAKREIRILTALFTWFPKVKEHLKTALRRGVNVKVLMQVEAGREVAKEAVSLGIEVRDAMDPWYPVRGTMADREGLVFLIWEAEEKNRLWHPVAYKPHKTRNPGLIRVFSDVFERLWMGSRPLNGGG